LEEFAATSLVSLWEKDLTRLEAELDAIDRKDAQEAGIARRQQAKAMSKTGEDDSLCNKQCVIVLSRNFCAKRVRASEWKAKRSGGKICGKNLCDKKKDEVSKKGTEGTKDVVVEGHETGEEADEEDEQGLLNVFGCYDYDALIVFSEDGMAYILQALDVPLAKKANSEGTPLKNFLPELGEQQSIAAMMVVDQGALRDQTDQWAALLSTHGMIKKVPLDRFRGLRQGKGVPAFTLLNGDTLRWAHRVSDKSSFVVVTAEGFVLRVASKGLKVGTLKGKGLPLMKIDAGDFIVSSTICEISPCDALPQSKPRQLPIEARGEHQKIAQKGSGFDDDSEHEEGTIAPAPTGPSGAREYAKGSALEEELEEEPVGDSKDSEHGGDDAEMGGKDSEHVGDVVEMSDEGESDDDESEAEAAGENVGPVQDQFDEQRDMAETSGMEGKAAIIDTEAFERKCALIVTEGGMGLRIPLDTSRLCLRRRGVKGRRVIRLYPGDRVLSISIISQSQDIHVIKPRTPWVIYSKEHSLPITDSKTDVDAQDDIKPTVDIAEHMQCEVEGADSDRKEHLSSVVDSSSIIDPKRTVDTPNDAEQELAKGVAESVECPAGGASWQLLMKKQKEYREIFFSLPEAVQEEYIARSKAETQAYQQQKQQQENQLLIGTASGVFARVWVAKVPLSKGTASKGRPILKLKDDRVCTVTLLSSIDSVPDEEKKETLLPLTNDDVDEDGSDMDETQVRASEILDASAIQDASSTKTPQSGKIASMTAAWDTRPIGFKKPEEPSLGKPWDQFKVESAVPEDKEMVDVAVSIPACSIAPKYPVSEPHVRELSARAEREWQRLRVKTRAALVVGAPFFSKKLRLSAMRPGPVRKPTVRLLKKTRSDVGGAAVLDARIASSSRNASGEEKYEAK